MDDTTKAMIGSIIRTVLITIGGGAFFGNDQITAIAGALAILVGAGWSLYQKHQAGQKLQAAKDLRS